MNAKISEAIIYLLLYNLHDYTFNYAMSIRINRVIIFEIRSLFHT